MSEPVIGFSGIPSVEYPASDQFARDVPQKVAVDHFEFRRLVEDGDHVFDDPFITEQVIGVEEVEDISSGGFDTFVHGAVDAAIWLADEVSYVVAIISQQFAFNSGRLSIVGPISNAISVVIPVIGAFVIFNEQLILEVNGQINLFFSFGKFYGLAFILLGVFLLRRAILHSEEISEIANF